MVSLLSLLPTIITFVGHVALWTWLYNRLHASGVSAVLVHRLEKYLIFSMLVTMFFPAALLLQYGDHWLTHGEGLASWLGRIWAIACYGKLIHVTAAWVVSRLSNPDGGLLLANETQILNTPRTLGYRPVGDWRTRWQSRIPGNQILEVHLQRKEIALHYLPPELDELRIAQLTDLHMTGQLRREFFDLVVDQMNAWEADIVAVTGDLVDKSACIQWIPETLGRLTSRFGIFALLGNHDQRLRDVQLLRDTLVDCGIVDLGGRSLLKEIRGVDVLLAGNECPWFPPAPTIPDLELPQRPLAILLSHSPDALPWARRHRFDVMLAGHTHGGQIRFPVVGPVVCPSRFGVRFASGLFDADPVVMHVSRGLSGVHTLRFNCPPEITLLELRRKKK